jgi:hypothetical protein
MRMNLVTKSLGQSNLGNGSFPLSLTIRPSCGLPGDYQFPSDIAALMRLLRDETNLSDPVLERFEGEARSRTCARLMGVELSDRLLTEIGYFID